MLDGFLERLARVNIGQPAVPIGRPAWLRGPIFGVPRIHGDVVKSLIIAAAAASFALTGCGDEPDSGEQLGAQ